MNLFEIKLPNKVYCPVSDGSKFIIVDHLDGMYSYGTSEKGSVIHLSRFAPLKKFKDGFKLVIEKSPKI